MLNAIKLFFCSIALGVMALNATPARAGEIADAYLLPELFEIMAQEGRASSLEDTPLPQGGSGRRAWEQIVADIYDPTRMMTAFEEELDKALTPQIREEALAFAQTRLGQRILQLEVSARRALLSDEIDDAARLALSRAREAASDSQEGRALARIRTRIAVNDLIELNVSLGLNTSLAYYNGMAEAGWMAGMAGADLLALVWAQEEAIRKDVTDWAESYFLLAYQPLDPDEMAAYLDHAASPAGDAFNRAMFRAFDTVFVDISKKLGAALARQMQEDTL